MQINQLLYNSSVPFIFGYAGEILPTYSLTSTHATYILTYAGYINTCIAARGCLAEDKIMLHQIVYFIFMLSTHPLLISYIHRTKLDEIM